MLLELLYNRITEDTRRAVLERREEWLEDQLHTGLTTLLNASKTLFGTETSLGPCITALVRLAATPGETPVLTKHWSTPLILSRVALGQISPAAAAARLGINLLFETCPAGSSALAGVNFTTPLDENAALPVLSRDLQIRFLDRGLARRTLTWRCHPSSVEVSIDDAIFLELPLPLGRETQHGAVALESYPVVQGWNLPIVEGGRETFFLDQTMAPTSRNKEPQDALPMAASLLEAHRILQNFWPEVIEWVQLLNPAFAGLEPAGTPTTHYSGSFGPGIPLYLSGVARPWFHAEDLVHEVQHQRFNLFLGESHYFETWHDTERKFVSPFRRDLRPLRGLHLGLHAFLAVNELRLRALGELSEETFSIHDLLRTHRQNVFCYNTILRGETLSENGRLYYDRVCGVLRQQAKSIGPLVSPEIEASVAAHLEQHLHAVADREHAYNGPLAESPLATSLN